MKELDYKQSKRVVLAKHPHAHMQSFSGVHLVDGLEGIALSDPCDYNNDLNEQHWLNAAKKIMAGQDA
jgi:hypothetical protein